MKKYLRMKLLILVFVLFSFNQGLFVHASDTSYSYFGSYLNRMTLPSKKIIVGKTGQFRPLSESIVADFEYAFTYSVSDSSVLSIDEKGNWKALKPGKVILIVENQHPNDSSPEFNAELSQRGISWKEGDTVPTVEKFAAYEEITVYPADKAYDYFGNHVDMATLPSKEVFVGTTGRIRPSQDSILKDFDYAFHYKVSDPSILSIDEKGNWKALKSGKVTIEVINQGMLETTPAFRDEFARHGLVNFYGSGDPVPAVYDSVIMDITVIKPQTKVYRLYHPQRGFHTYIKGDGERSRLEERGWRYEGVAWSAALEGNQPVYRLYNAKKDAYVYTRHTSEVERLKAAGWRYEGVVFQSSGTKPVYRFYNKRAGIHFYTANPAERDKLKGNANYRYEGFAWYSE